MSSRTHARAQRRSFMSLPWMCVYIYIYDRSEEFWGFWAQGLVVATSSAPRDFKQWYEYSRFIDSTPFCLTSRMLVQDVENGLC